jgi:hypothetical protein
MLVLCFVEGFRDETIEAQASSQRIREPQELQRWTGVEVWEKCPNLVDGLRCMAIETNDRTEQSPNERLSFICSVFNICSVYFRWGSALFAPYLIFAPYTSVSEPCIVVTTQIGNPWRCLECAYRGVQKSHLLLRAAGAQCAHPAWIWRIRVRCPHFVRPWQIGQKMATVSLPHKLYHYTPA